MQIKLELPGWVADAITRGPAPMVDCGPDLAERIGYICENWADHIIRWEEQDKRKALYRALGIPLDEDKDDIIDL